MLNQAGFQTLRRNMHKDEEVISPDLSWNIKEAKWDRAGTDNFWADK